MKKQDSKVVQAIETAIHKITYLEQENVKEYSEEYDMEFSYIGNMLRKALELFSEEILQKYQITYEENTTLFDKLQLIRKEQIFTERQLSLFEKVRYIGNTAVHTNNFGYPNTQSLKTIAYSFLDIVKRENQVAEKKEENPKELAEKAFKYYYNEDMRNTENILTLKKYMNDLLRILSFNANQMQLENESVCSKKEIAEFQEKKRKEICFVEEIKTRVENSKTSDEDLMKWASNESNIRKILIAIYSRFSDNISVEKNDIFAYKFLVHNDIFPDETIEEYDSRKTREKNYPGIGRYESIENYRKRKIEEEEKLKKETDERRKKAKREYKMHKKRIIYDIFLEYVYMLINFVINLIVLQLVWTAFKFLANYW